MGISSWEAHAALVDRLKTINGIGYWHNLSGRVYTRFVDPTSGQTFPYVCVPLDAEDGGDYPMVEPTVVQTSQSVTIVGFVPESSSAVRDSQAVEAALKLRDDILKAVMSDWTLGGKVNDLTPVRHRAGAGFLDYGFAEVTVRWALMQGLDNLGP